MTPIPSFQYQANPTRVVFGTGCVAQVPAEAERLGLHRLLVLSGPGHADLARRVAGDLGAACAGVFSEAVMHVPLHTAQAARALAVRCHADGVVAVGGGSPIGLAKAIALEQGLPIVAVPTTYAGSEMTSIHGITDGGVKKTGRDPRVRPRTALYDPELTLALPADLTVTSAVNAMAHAAEALYAHDGNPVVSLMAEEGLRAFIEALPALREAPRDPQARGRALYGAWLCGAVLDAVSMGLHHKLCHTLGGSFGLPHAQTHTVVLPHALAYNAPAAGAAMQRLAQALGTGDAAQAPRALQQWSVNQGAPASLRDLGLPESALDRAADLAVAAPYPNPRPLERTALRALLQRAWEGAPAQ